VIDICDSSCWAIGDIQKCKNFFKGGKSGRNFYR
jgi:hypothetical protein